MSEIASALCAVAADTPHIGLHLCHDKTFGKGVRAFERVVGDVRIVEYVEHFTAFFAFKMDVRSYVRIVAQFIVFDFERVSEVFFFEYLLRIVSGRLRQRRIFGRQGSVERFHCRMYGMLAQIGVDRNALYRGSDAGFAECRMVIFHNCTSSCFISG